MKQSLSIAGMEKWPSEKQKLHIALGYLDPSSWVARRRHNQAGHRTTYYHFDMHLSGYLTVESKIFCTNKREP